MDHVKQHDSLHSLGIAGKTTHLNKGFAFSYTNIAEVDFEIGFHSFFINNPRLPAANGGHGDNVLFDRRWQDYH